MTEREARIAFNMIPTVGAVTLARLMRETHGSAAAAYEFYPEKRDWEGKEPAWERELFVSPDGSDDGDGSEGAPFRTIGRAAETA